MSEGIAYQNKDIISKVFTESFGSKSLDVYGLHVPKIVRLLPTNLPAVEANELRIDNLLELEDGSIAILDYESEYSRSDKAKYMNYMARVYRGNVEQKKHRDIRMLVIYTADVKPESVQTSVDMSGFSIRIEAAFLSKLPSEDIRHKLTRRIKNGEQLSDEELMELIILPLTYKTKEKKQELIKEAIDLAKQVKDEKQSTFLVAGILVFSDKVIDDVTKEKAKEWMKMTQIGRMFEQEKQEAVNNAVNNAVIENTRNNLFKYVNAGGMSLDFAAQQANMSVEDFSKAMEEHGYRVPQLA